MLLRGLPYQVSPRSSYAHGMLGQQLVAESNVFNGLYSDPSPTFKQVLYR